MTVLRQTNAQFLQMERPKIKPQQKHCQQWDSNPRPFGPVPETGALDQLGHIDLMPLPVDFGYINVVCGLVDAGIQVVT